jgi:His/Glu/Gln/Arg/opine family amino acid ABC transporter permease subunit
MSWYDIIATLLFGFPLPVEMLDPRYPSFLQRSAGLWLTLTITFVSLGVGFLIGLPLALCRRESVEGGTRGGRMQRMIRRLARLSASVLVQGVRGIPIMLLVLLVFDLPYRLWQFRVPPSILAMIAFSVYSGVYLSEMMRSGLRSVNSELKQAGKVLGLSRLQTLVKIELPLVCGTMMPDLVNLTITIFKDTATLSVVAVAELTYTARQILISEPASYGIIWLYVLILYWIVAILLSTFFYIFERRLAARQRRTEAIFELHKLELEVAAG